MASMSFMRLATLCEDLASTSKRTVKTQLISAFIRELEEEEISPAVSFIVGRAFPEPDPRVLDISARTLGKVLERSKQPPLVQEPLTISGVYRTFEEIARLSGKGSRMRKESLLESLLGQAALIEAKYLAKIIFGEMQIGVVEGVMLDAIAEASSVNQGLVRRSHMFLGNLGEVARIALRHGKIGLEGIGIRLFNPIKPMLAEMAYEISEVLIEHGGETAFEYKFDGARIQIHKRGSQVRIFSRRLTDVTNSLPDIVTLASSGIRANEALLEGEVVAVGAGEKPLPFQDLMRRFRRVHEISQVAREIPLRLYLFDLLYLNGESLVDVPYEDRWRSLSEICDEGLLAKRIVTGDVSIAEEFLKEALDAGHEGVMAKSLKSKYTPGVRGKKWFKIKPADRLDLAVIAADWGYGRRTGWLSNYHLAAIDETTGDFLMVGKTFKGLTDEEFIEMTRKLLSLKVSEGEYTVRVKPSIVVEVAYNEIQKSPQYMSGLALRFARIVRIREDKSVKDIDSIQRLRDLYQKQFEHKARPGL